MNAHEFFSLSVYSFIFTGYIFFGNRVALFASWSASALAGYLLLMRYIKGAETFYPQDALTVIGFIFFISGLLLLQSVVSRSVTVKLMRKGSSDLMITQMKKDINSRIADILRLKLARKREGKMELTLFGNFIVSIVILSYTLFGMKK